MNALTKLAAMAIVAAVAIGGVMFVIDRGPAGPGGPPAPTPTASPRPPGPMAGPLRVGTYLGPTLQVAGIVAALNADPTLTAADRTRIIDVYLEIRGKATWSVSIELRAGQLTERQAVDGIWAVGSFGTYAFPDDRTLIYTERLDGREVVTAFELAIDGDSFTLHRTTPADDAAGEFVTRVIFESGPFTLQ